MYHKIFKCGEKLIGLSLLQRYVNEKEKKSLTDETSRKPKFVLIFQACIFVEDWYFSSQKLVMVIHLNF